jgi:hypothetical protein
MGEWGGRRRKKEKIEQNQTQKKGGMKIFIKKGLSCRCKNSPTMVGLVVARSQ